MQMLLFVEGSIFSHPEINGESPKLVDRRAADEGSSISVAQLAYSIN